MTELKGIRGWRVRSLSSDPAASILATGSWASGGTMNNPYEAIGGDGGTSSAAFAAGGVLPTYYNTTHEQYDGSTWTSSTAMNTSRAFGGAGGTTTAAFVATGRVSPTSVTANTELWNGSAWTEVNNVNTGRFGTGGGLGTQTAGLLAPGSTVPAVVDSVESWNGTSWTAVTTYPGSAHEGIMQFGTNTSAIYAGGYGGPSPRGGDTLYKTEVYEWNGSTFSAETSLPTIRGNAASAGTVNDGLISGGWEGSIPAGGTTTNTTHYDGTTWTELNNLSTSAQGWGSSKSGTTSDTIVFGGSNTNTEEWTLSATPTTFSKENEGQVYFNTTANALKFTKYSMPAGTWASGGSLNTARSSMTGVGTQTATLAPSGQNTSTSLTPATEEYNGTAWSEVNDIPTTLKYQGAGGIQTAGWNAAGISAWDAASFNPAIFLYDGTNWTSGPSVNTNRYYTYGGGPQTACFITTGNNTSFTAVGNTELYNGSAWTEVADTNTVRNQGWANGITTDGIVAGGAPGAKTETELFDGTSWTEVNNLNTGRLNPGAGGGTSPGSNQIMCTGENAVPTPLGVVEFWNGTTWTEVADTAATNSSAAGGNSGGSSAIIMGGFSPSPATFATITEEWTVPLANATVTTS